jgi:hypothetical protein
LRRFILGAQSEPLDIIENLYPKKPSFRPSKWPQKLKTAKNSKLPKLPENCFEPVGKGGWPPISTWISFSKITSWTRSQGLISFSMYKLSIENNAKTTPWFFVD